MLHVKNGTHFVKLHFRGQCSCVLFEAPLFLVLLWLYYLIGLFLYFVVADNHIVVCVVVRVGVLVLLGCSKNIACFECLVVAVCLHVFVFAVVGESRLLVGWSG